MLRPRNEGKVCDAVIRDIERRTKLTRTDLTRPEITKVGPPVDFEFILGSTRYSLEHTELQSFPEQIGQGIDFSRMIEGPIEALSRSLPKPGVYYLTLPTSTRVGSNKLEDVRSKLAAWVLEQAVAWRDAKPTKQDQKHAPNSDSDRIDFKPPGVPFSVRFERRLHWAQSDRFDGQLFTVRFSPNDLEKRRRESLEVSLGKKLPKLAKCKRNGSRTILVLEESDIALSNQSAVLKALKRVTNAISDLPDEIYLVSTFVEKWCIYPLFLDGRFLSDAASIERSHEFIAKGLHDLAEH